ncbi:NAD(P)H-quinone dehydrogenase [Devriesea agamarum]|uniref:NAD(P)H-quinone dehydrogenase n=1 Tax=Devriesea agamarum TaxID=472569 RepID=UPI000A0564C2
MTDPSIALPPESDRVRLSGDQPHVAVIGGGPGGYEAALTAARLGADVTLVESQGVGGAAVLTDVVPSKTLIATAEVLDLVADSHALGIRGEGGRDLVAGASLCVDLDKVNERVRELAAAQSRDITASLTAAGVRIVCGRGALAGPRQIRVELSDGGEEVLTADVGLLAVGARPRQLPTAPIDGERILTWTQLYNLTELPAHLVVVGSGVTGAEFASAYRALGSQVTLVSSRDQVLPGADRDAAAVLENAFVRRGITVRSRTRAIAVRRDGDGVQVELSDGDIVQASHALMAVGAVPATDGLGLEQAHVRCSASGHIQVDRVSRTNVRGLYAAGDCTGIYPLASVAAMQGRIAMYHALGDAVSPLIARQVASATFTAPEVATVGYTEQDIEDGLIPGEVRLFPLSTNPRAKMQGVSEGFVKLIARPGSGTVIGGVVVAPRASELIHPISLAVSHRMTVDELAAAFTVYPSLSGSLAEAARSLHLSV